MNPFRAVPVLLLAALAAAPGAQDSDPGAERDRVLADVVRERLAEREELDGVQVEVADGVVRLSGKVLTSLARTDAEAVARGAGGARGVVNEIESVWDVPGRLRPVLGRLRDRAFDVIALLPLLVLALIVLAASWYLARFASRRRRPYGRIRNPFLRDLVRQLTRAAVFLVGLLVALEIVGATALVGAVLGTAGVVSLVVGLAFRDLAENYLAAVLLSLRQPFEPDDHVAIDGREGKVMRLTSRATILMTLDGNHLHVPNAMVFKGVILNYTRNPLRRFEFVVPLGKGADAGAAPAVIAAVRGVAGVRPEPEPAAEFAVLLADRTELRVTGWVDQRRHDFARVRSEALRAARESLERPSSDGRRAGGAAADTSVDRDLEQQMAADRKTSAGDLLDARAGEGVSALVRRFSGATGAEDLSDVSSSRCSAPSAPTASSAHCNS